MKQTLTLKVRQDATAPWGTLETLAYDDAARGMTRKAAMKRMTDARAGWQSYWKYADAQFAIVDSAEPAKVDPNATHDLYRAWIAADVEMTAELVRLFGKDACDRRYDSRMKGWSDRAKQLAAEFQTAGKAWRVACGHEAAA
jgi:hypothetical protein